MLLVVIMDGISFSTVFSLSVLLCFGKLLICRYLSYIQPVHKLFYSAKFFSSFSYVF